MHHGAGRVVSFAFSTRPYKGEAVNGWDTNAAILQAALIFLPIVLMIIVGLAMLTRG